MGRGRRGGAGRGISGTAGGRDGHLCGATDTTLSAASDPPFPPCVDVRVISCRAGPPPPVKNTMFFFNAFFSLEIRFTACTRTPEETGQNNRERDIKAQKRKRRDGERGRRGERRGEERGRQRQREAETARTDRQRRERSRREGSGPGRRDRGVRSRLHRRGRGPERGSARTGRAGPAGFRPGGAGRGINEKAITATRDVQRSGHLALLSFIVFVSVISLLFIFRNLFRLFRTSGAGLERGDAREK